MRRRSLSALLAARDAVTAVEFALMAVPFLTLSLGTLEFGRVMWTQEALQMTATQGARCMGLRASSCASGGVYSASATTAHLIAIASGWDVKLVSAEITATNSSSNAACPGSSEVSISYPFHTAFPGLLTMLAGQPTLTGHACFPNQSS